MNNLAEVNANLMADCKELRMKQNDNLNFISELRLKSTDHKSNINQLFSRMQKSELHLESLDHLSLTLKATKCEQTEFISNLTRLDELLHKLDEDVNLTRNLCYAVENCVEKYQPVRTQAMIGETLKACLTGEMTRKHELYDNEKIQLLYSVILGDSGSGSDIQKLISKLNAQAE